MCCPKCKSNEWKSAHLVHSDGLSENNSSGIGIGMAAGGAGVGLGSSSGVSQTELSMKAAPPVKKEGEGGVFDGIFGLSLIIFIIGCVFYYDASFTLEPIKTTIFFKIVPIVGILSFILSKIYPNVDSAMEEEYMLAMKEYEQKRMCLRCGNFYLPNTNL